MDRRSVVAAGALLLVIAAAAWWWNTSEMAPVPANGSTTALQSPSSSPSSDPGSREAPPVLASPGPRDEVVAGQPTVALGGTSPLDDDELAALEQDLAADPRTHVVCDLGIDVRHGEAYLAIGGHSEGNGRRVQVVNGTAYLPLVYDLGDLGEAQFSERSGMFSLDGYGPQTIAWTDRPDAGHGSCTSSIDPEPGQASLTGTLTLRPSGAPAAGGWIEGCGNMAYADQHGVVHMDIVPEPCSILAMRQDGLLRTMSDPVSVVPQAGRDVVVDIEIPEAPRGGLGVQVGVDDAGRIAIEGLLETGPAGAAGLQQGDVVLTVNGTPTSDMSLAEFVRAVGGEAGTTVQITVDRGGEELAFDLVRDVLTPG